MTKIMLQKNNHEKQNDSAIIDMTIKKEIEKHKVKLEEYLQLEKNRLAMHEFVKKAGH